MSNTVQIIDSGVGCPEIPIVEGAGNAKVVVWPGNGALYRTFQMITLGQNASTVSLTHPSDAAYYIVEGTGSVVDLSTEHRQALEEGSMVHIDAHDQYRFVAGQGGLKILGGPCPADERLYAGLSRG